MKLKVQIVLILFMSFLATPTVLGVINADVDTSYFYNMAEEEENHVSFNEIKMLPAFFSIPNLKMLLFKNNNFNVIDDLKLKSLSINIFLPPPELI